MAVLEIYEYPHPILALQAREVRDDEFGPELEKRLADMAETMYAAPGVGLAAPQVGDSRRVVVLDPGEKDQRGKRLFKMVNPQIVERSDDFIFWDETCLSVPGLEVPVKRHKRVRVTWRGGDGQPQSGWFTEYEAVIVQHELDHLIGTVLADRVSAFKRSRWMKKRKKSRDPSASYA